LPFQDITLSLSTNFPIELKDVDDSDALPVPLALDGCLIQWLPLCKKCNNAVPPTELLCPSNETYLQYQNFCLKEHHYQSLIALQKQNPKSFHLKRMAEWSDMTVLDYIHCNTDRYFGDNLKTYAEDGPLVLIDNGKGGKRRCEQDSGIIDTLCLFNNRTIARVLKYFKSEEDVKILNSCLKVLTKEAHKLGLLRDTEAYNYVSFDLRALYQRIQSLLAHAAQCERRWGADVVWKLLPPPRPMPPFSNPWP